MERQLEISRSVSNIEPHLAYSGLVTFVIAKPEFLQVSDNADKLSSTLSIAAPSVTEDSTVTCVVTDTGTDKDVFNTVHTLKTFSMSSVSR